jgi:hypothetical protein
MEPSDMLEKLEPLNPQPQDMSRLTVLLTVHHEQVGEQPRTFPLTFSDLLETTQESYSRRMRATEEWTPLDFGWIHPSEVGYLMIDNIEGRGLAIQPTREEKALTASHVIELAYVSSLDDSWEIPPRWFFFNPIKRPADLRIRCQHETASYRITVIPK